MKRNLLFTVLLIVSGMAFGQKLPFQGKLIEAGTPVEGTRTFVFEIAALGWSETHADVSVTDGLYFVVLGSIYPLPDSLFYDADERSMSVSVDGTPLSTVSLFKPLTPPFNGSELEVKNDEGTVVGEMYARTDSVFKNGELRIYGTNGNLNARLAGSGPGGNLGSLTVHSSGGVPKTNMFIIENANAPEGVGLFTVLGNNQGALQGGFKFWEGSEGANRPFLSFEGNDVANKSLIWMETEKPGSVESGKILINSNANEEMYLSPTGIFAKNNGTQLAEFTTQNWGGQGQSGLIKVNSPSGQTKVQMTTKSWENAELPWFNMFGTVNNDIVQISAANDSNESGFISVFSRDNKEASFYPTGFRFNRNGQNWREFATLHIDDKDNTGDAGYFGLRGPNSDNINFGGRHWEGNADLPFVHFIGENNFLGIDMGMSKNNEGQQSGFINLMSENGKNLYLSPEGLGVQGVSMSTTVNQNGNFGSFTLHGPNSDNFQLMPSWWDQPDLPRMLLLGTSQIAAVDMGAFPENGFEVGQIGLSSTDGSSAHWSPQHLDLHNGFRTVSLASVNNNEGTFGSLILDGPNSRNITLMPEWWDKPDMARMILSGTSNGSVDMEVADEGNGQFGLIHLYSDYQKSIRMEPTYIALRDDANGFNPLVFISTNNDNGSWVGTVDVNGPNSGNVHIGSQLNPDLPWITLQGTDGFEAMQIGAIDDATQRGFIKMVNKQSGEEMFYSSHGVGGNTPFQISGGAIISGTLEVNGDITGTGNFGYSDSRLKTNIQSLGVNTLQKIQRIKGVSYNWRQDEFPEKNFSSDNQIGLIAQELEAQFPSLVKTNKDGYKSVNYNGFTAVLLEAVKELNAKVEKLETENSQLKAELSASASNKTEINQLKAQMESLVKWVQGQQSTAMEEANSTSEIK